MLLALYGIVLLLGLVIFLDFQNSADFILFYLVSVPGMVALCHCFDLTLLQEKEHPFVAEFSVATQRLTLNYLKLSLYPFP